MFGKKRSKGKQKGLNERFQVLDMDMENNYKDAAQMDFKRVKELFLELKEAGKMSASDITYYRKQKPLPIIGCIII